MSSNANAGRRRSGVWNVGTADVDTDAMGKEKETRRHRWTPGKKEPTMYDDYLNLEKKRHRASGLPSKSRTLQRRPSMPLRSGSTAGRPETPENAPGALGLGTERRDAEESTASLERSYTPSSVTRTDDRPSSSSKSRRDRERITSPPRSRKGSFSLGAAFLGRSRSRHKAKQDSYGEMAESESSSRPQTGNAEVYGQEQSTGRLRSRSRRRMGSINTHSSPISQGGAEYLASVPGSTQQPSAPSISSVGSPVRSPSPRPRQRSISPMSSSTADSITSALPSANARRILHLMKTLNGRMSGNVVFRRGFGNPWSQSYCYINDESGSLMYESRGSEGAHKVLAPELRGSSVRSNLDGDVPYLELSFPHITDEVHIKLQTQSDFDAWFAALLHWTPRGDVHSTSSSEHRSDSEMGIVSQTASTTDLAQKRRGSANDTVATRERATSKASTKSDPRRSIIGGATKENPVIKIGKMIYWDTNVGHNQSGGLGQPWTARPDTGRHASTASRRWRRISGQLRENGELKLHSDADNSLISVVQLSQLSRCAIQRLDTSVLDDDFCIAIYPQYTSSFTNPQPGFVRPIFLSLENRVLFEVWFVLLRAFTMPSIYGPRIDADESELGDGSNQDLENMIATSTTYTFRMERSLSVRIGEAKMQPSAGSSNTESGFTSGFGKSQNPEKHGYYAEVLLDNETRGKTVAKYQGLNPLWGESFEFQDLPPVLNNASVIIKRRPPEQSHSKDHSDKDKSKGPDAYGEQQGGYTSLANDVVCGKVEIQMEELEPEKEVEKWWPVTNMHGQRVGEVLIKVRADEGIILMARDYQKLSVMLHRFSNALTLHIAQTIPTELKRLSDSLLNIFQVSGKAGDWIMALIEEEIDGSHKESPITRLRYSGRSSSNDHGEPMMSGNQDRELIVRDLNKNATLEANLLFRGNTLLTKSLDTHMRRVGKEYLEESLAAKLQDINDKNEDCEVDPNRVNSPSDLDRNWRRLLLCTQEVWKGVVANKARCPVELRIIFRHIRACAEDRYGDFLRSVSYSSVSGFLFLRFFCPAVLNPKLFGLLKDDIKPRARRTFTLIAKSLQTMANMASFGTKEPWMEPMNVFLVQHRESFKTFIDDVCFVPAPLSNASYPNAPNSPTYAPGVVSAEQHLSYTTPMTIMQRLPPSSREGFPSLPYLIDQARSFADLIHLWLEAVMALSNPSDSATLPGKTHSDILDAIIATDGELKDFHVLCEELNTRTQECLNRAERAERPDSPHSFQWEDVINQLQKAQVKNSSKEAFDNVATKIANDPSLRQDDGAHAATIDSTIRVLRGQNEDDEESNAGQGLYNDPTLARTEPVLVDSTPRSHNWGRPESISHHSSFQGSIGRGYSQSVHDSPGQSGMSSAVSSDTEHTTTALPSYDREVRHRERREMARFQIQKQVEAAKSRETEKNTQKEKKKMTSKLVPNLMKKRKDKDGEKEKQGFAKLNGGSSANASGEFGGMI